MGGKQVFQKCSPIFERELACYFKQNIISNINGFSLINKANNWSRVQTKKRTGKRKKETD